MTGSTGRVTASAKVDDRVSEAAPVGDASVRSGSAHVGPANTGSSTAASTDAAPAHIGSVGSGTADAVLEQLLAARHSCRAFLPDQVPRDVVTRILQVAQRTASWCNCQPWQVDVVSGAAARRLRDALLARAGSGVAGAPDFPFPRAYQDEYLARRRECGFQLYEAVGVARGDRAAYQRQHDRNFALFDAPHVAIISSDEPLGVYGAIDCGGYVSTFLLAAQAMGVAAVPQASLAMYPDLLREQLGLSERRRVVCGISFGYEDADAAANGYRTTRAPLQESVRWHE